MQRFIDNSLESNWFQLTARVRLALMFAASGLARLFDYQASLGEIYVTGPEPTWPFNIATAVALLAGSALILLDRKLWLGAGAPTVLLLLTILTVHTFWSKTGVKARLTMFFTLEHIAVIDGLIATATAGVQRQRLRRDISMAAAYRKT